MKNKNKLRHETVSVRIGYDSNGGNIMVVNGIKQTFYPQPVGGASVGKQDGIISSLLKRAVELEKQIKDQQELIEAQKACNRLMAMNLDEKEREIKVTEELLADRQKVLDAIPECPMHGRCVPHALDWIKEASRLMEFKNNFERAGKK